MENVTLEAWTMCYEIDTLLPWFGLEFDIFLAQKITRSDYCKNEFRLFCKSYWVIIYLLFVLLEFQHNSEKHFELLNYSMLLGYMSMQTPILNIDQLHGWS